MIMKGNKKEQTKANPSRAGTQIKEMSVIHERRGNICKTEPKWKKERWGDILMLVKVIPRRA